MSLEAPPVVDPAKPTPAALRATRDKLWRMGQLSWKLDVSQRALHKEIVGMRKRDRTVVLAGRGWGKSYIALLMAIETCLQGKRDSEGRFVPTQVAYVTKTKKQGRANLRGSAEEILKDCPRAIRPTYLKNDSEYAFPNGSVLYLVGVDAERYDFLRGRSLDGVVVDEAQDVDELDEIVRVILEPCVLRVGGWIVLAGTVPQRDTHEFVGFIREAKGAECCVVRTTMDSPRYTDATKAEMMRRAGGASSNAWLREYMAELRFSDERAVIPEWSLKGAGLTRTHERPEFCDKYVGLDFGFARDLTVALFGYYDFANAQLIIEDELQIRGGTTAKMAGLLEGKLTDLWGPADSRMGLHQFADGNEARTIHELKTLHKLNFKATDKRDKEASINRLKMLVAEDRLVVDPRCKLLVKTLYQATWNKKFDSYTRSDEIGHADALDALLYLSRNVNQRKNPVLDERRHWTMDGKAAKTAISGGAQALGDCFGGGPSNSPMDKLRGALKKLGRRR